jgi:type IV pilus assembly protein PilM
MAQTVIGLDIGSWSIKAAVLDSGLRRQDLVDFREHHVPADLEGNPMDDQAALIRATLDGIRDRNALITAAPGSRVMQRELELPFTDDKRIKSVLAFQLDGQLPLPVEALVYDYTILEELDPGARILCSAVARKWLTGFLEELKGANADPKAVCLDSMAPLHLVPKLREIGAIGAGGAGGDGDEGEEEIAFIDIGHRTTTLTIVRGDHVVTGRSLPNGGHQVTVALQEALGGDYHQAERLKHEGVRLDGQVPAGVEEAEHDRRVEIVASALSPIVRDLRMTLHAHAQRAGKRVKRAFLFGGTTRMPGLMEAVGQGLGIAVTLPRTSRFHWARSSGRADDHVDGAGAALLERAQGRELPPGGPGLRVGLPGHPRPRAVGGVPGRDAGGGLLHQQVPAARAPRGAESAASGATGVLHRGGARQEVLGLRAGHQVHGAAAQDRG